MPQEPKKRHSRARQGKRRAHIQLSIPKTVVCPNCKASTLAHTVCKKCGYYDGRQYFVIDKTVVRKVAKEETS